jgi:hypothetical protein
MKLSPGGKQKTNNYNVCYRFRIMKIFLLLLKQVVFFEEVVTVAKIGFSLKANQQHHKFKPSQAWPNL